MAKKNISKILILNNKELKMVAKYDSSIDKFIINKVKSDKLVESLVPGEQELEKFVSSRVRTKKFPSKEFVEIISQTKGKKVTDNLEVKLVHH